MSVISEEVAIFLKNQGFKGSSVAASLHSFHSNPRPLDPLNPFVDDRRINIYDNG